MHDFMVILFFKMTKNVFLGGSDPKISILQSRNGNSHTIIFWRLFIKTAISKQYKMQLKVHDFRVISLKLTENMRILGCL